MQIRQTGSGVQDKRKIFLIKRLLPLFIFILIYALLLARPLFMVSGYSGGTSFTPKGGGIFNSVSKSLSSYFAPDDLDLAISKSHSGDFVIGQNGQYTINVVNVGTETIQGSITVTDSLPLGLTPVIVEAPGWDPCPIDGQTLTCEFTNPSGVAPSTNLPPIMLTVSVDELAAPVVTNTANLSNANDVNSTNNVANDETTIVSADLQVSKSVSPAIAAEGATVDYTISILNQGPSSTTGVVLTDTLPAGVTFSSANPSRGNYNPGTGNWTVGDLNNGEEVSLTIAATVDIGGKGLLIVNSTEGVKSDLFDPDDSNNEDSASIRVLSTALTGLVSDAASTQPVISATITITDSVNHVYSTTTNASGWYTVTDTLAEPLAPGPFSISGTKDGYEPATAASVLVADEVNRLDLQLDTTDLFITKKDGISTVIPGQLITYTVAITNVGSINASDLIITDVMDTYLSYITDTLGITHTVPTSDTLVWEIDDDLAVNNTRTFSVVFEVDDALPSPTTEIANNIEVSTSSPEANLSNNSYEDINTSTGTPNISIKKSVSPSQARTGQTVTYKIEIENTGTAPATDLEIVDDFSLYLNITRVSTTSGTATTNTTTRRVTVEVDVIDPDEEVTITVVTRVNTTATTNRFVSNFAKLSYLFGGTTTTKNSNTVSFQLIASSTLPGTGGSEPSQLDPMDARLLLPGLIIAVLLGIAGLLVLGYGYSIRSNKSGWSSWCLKIGALLLVTAVIFGFVAIGLNNLAPESAPQLLLRNIMAREVGKGSTHDFEVIEPEVVPMIFADDPEVLPDFPIPTPTIEVVTNGDEKPPDTSPIEWIQIPEIGVDTVVKYVPYDGFTWLIDGLKQEVAWMGDSSWPGLKGNVALAGHVTLSGGGDGPFRHINMLDDNDTIRLYTQENVYTYSVREKNIVEETDTSVLESADEQELTLITCTDWDEEIGFYMKRLVVSADLIKVDPLRSVSKSN